jgi:hypothetical protein
VTPAWRAFPDHQLRAGNGGEDPDISLGPGLPKSSLHHGIDRPCLQPPRQEWGAARAALDRVAAPSSPKPLIKASALGRPSTEVLEETIDQARGLTLGVQESDRMIAPGWKCIAIQHSRGCDRNSELVSLPGFAFRSDMGNPYPVFRCWIVYVRVGAPGAAGQNASRT